MSSRIAYILFTVTLIVATVIESAGFTLTTEVALHFLNAIVLIGGVVFATLAEAVRG